MEEDLLDAWTPGSGRQGLHRGGESVNKWWHPPVAIALILGGMLVTVPTLMYVSAWGARFIAWYFEFWNSLPWPK